ncbi:MAG: ATP-grasp domain-containing protein [Candidatus Eremiobacteraeota bacterium]|nr:ATP-grasp domain-containing protein [Candidatus Eremiobacteraeota bacterium]
MAPGRRILARDGRLQEALDFYASRGYQISLYHHEDALPGFIKERAFDYFLLSHPGEIPFCESLEARGAHLVGAGFLRPSASLDKIRQKEKTKALGLSTPPSVVIRRHEKDSFLLTVRTLEMKPPYIIKNPAAHGSRGVTLLATSEEMESRVPDLLSDSDVLIMEHFIEARELALCLMGEDEALLLPPVEIFHGGRLFSREAKLQGFTISIPAALTKRERGRLSELAMRAYRAFECHGMVRLDMLLGRDGTPYLLEIMSFGEGMSSHHLSTRSAACLGIGFFRLLLLHLDWAHSRAGRRGHG